MPRANRYRLPGYVWHVTHRCHKRAFLLKFKRDRRRWRHWAFEAKKRFRLRVLNYVVTSNHIHLLVQDRGHDEIARSMQLIAGRTAQEYNRRKQHNGAFWEDRYHATAVDTGEHLLRCLAYIDLNTVRAGATTHPAQWAVSGYKEIQNQPKRYAVIDRTALASLIALTNASALAAAQSRWVADALQADANNREPAWSGRPRESFVETFWDRLGIGANYRQVQEIDGMCALRESPQSYDHVSGQQMGSPSSIFPTFQERT